MKGGNMNDYPENWREIATMPLGCGIAASDLPESIKFPILVTSDIRPVYESSFFFLTANHVKCAKCEQTELKLDESCELVIIGHCCHENHCLFRWLEVPNGEIPDLNKHTLYEGGKGIRCKCVVAAFEPRRPALLLHRKGKLNLEC